MPLCTAPPLGLLTGTVRLPKPLRRVENAACGFSTVTVLVDNAARLSTLRFDRSHAPEQMTQWAPKRPVEEAERRCCVAGFEAGRRESSDGPWMVLRSVPAKRHRSEGSRSEAKTRIPGQAFLVTFAATGKSDPPSRAEPKGSADCGSRSGATIEEAHTDFQSNTFQTHIPNSTKTRLADLIRHSYCHH